jgi:hypothetical protein
MLMYKCRTGTWLIRWWATDLCTSSCRTLSHYGSNQMIARSYLLGLMQWVWPWFGVTLAARKQRRKLSSWPHVLPGPLLCCGSVQSASCLRASRSKWLLWLMNYKGLWKKTTKICFNVLSGHGMLAQGACIPSSQPRDKMLRLWAGCRETLRCYPTDGPLSLPSTFLVHYNPKFETAYQTNSRDRVLRKLIAAYPSQKFLILRGCRKLSTRPLTGSYSQLV